MNTLLCSAIRNRRLVTFYYDGGRRIVKLGTAMERARLATIYCARIKMQVSADRVHSDGWKMFRVSELSGLAMTDEMFATSRPEYDPTREDKMVTVFCRV